MKCFDLYKKAPFLSKKTINDHLGLLKGYEETVTDLLKKLKRIDKKDSRYADLLKNLRYNYNAQALHRIYFDQVSDTAKRPSVKIKAHINNLANKMFKDFDDWKVDFLAAAKVSKGWTVLGYDPLHQCLRNVIVDEHDVGLPPAFFPILVLDTWEHAYIGDFGTNKSKYVNKWFQHINWDTVEAMINRWSPLYISEDLQESVTASLKYRMVTLGIAKE